MQNTYKYNIQNPDFEYLGYLVGTANTEDKHDRSAPTHYHWKILKCRMIIFSNSSILACPDKQEMKRVHIVFNKKGDDYDKITSLLMKFSLEQDGAIRPVTSEVFQICFNYTMTARLAPAWNLLGFSYFINNRDFLTIKGPQEGVKYNISCNERTTVLELKPMKINLSVGSDDTFMPGEWIRVLPSLNKAVVEDYHESMPLSGSFRSYKDLRRHWKNIHGYRIPEAECPYYSVRFWRGEPLTYPAACVRRAFPAMAPVPRPDEQAILWKFLSSFKSRMPHFLGTLLTINKNNDCVVPNVSPVLPDTQAISLCTPTQHL